MKKVLFINTLYSPDIGGGAEIILQKQVEGLSRFGHKVIVLATKETGKLSFDYVNNIKVYRAPLKNIFWPYNRKKHSFFKKFYWHLKDKYNKKMIDDLVFVINIEKPEVIITNNLSGWSIAIWEKIKRLNIPLIHVLHDYYLLSPKVTLFDEKNLISRQTIIDKFFRLGFRKKSSEVVCVIGVSQFILEQLTKNGYFRGTQKNVIYNQINLSLVPNCYEIKNNNSLSIGFIGTLSKIKGVELLIKSFRNIDIDANLLIAGKGEKEYETMLKNLAIEDDRIQFLGYLDSNEFYKKIDLLVIPSLWEEPFGLVAVESCANNVPVIASNKGGLKEIIVNNVNGMLVEPNEKELTDSILFYYQNPQILMEQSRTSRNAVNKFLNIDFMIEEYSKLIQTM